MRVDIIILVAFVVCVIFLLLRQVNLWYWRINDLERRLGEIEHNTAKLSEIEKHLAKIAAKYQ